MFEVKLLPFIFQIHHTDTLVFNSPAIDTFIVVFSDGCVALYDVEFTTNISESGIAFV